MDQGKHIGRKIVILGDFWKALGQLSNEFFTSLWAFLALHSVLCRGLDFETDPGWRRPDGRVGVAVDVGDTSGVGRLADDDDGDGDADDDV